MNTAIYVLGLLLFVVTACMSDAPPPPDVPVQPPVIASAAATPVPLVVKKFDSAKAKELAVVMAPDATAEGIATVRERHKRAARALSALGLQRDHPTAAVLREAADAVQALEQAVKGSP